MINKYSNLPLYSQLKELIISKIENGEYAENTKISSEQELCDTYDISRPTVRQAISELTNSGYIYKEKGKGTFVSSKKILIDIKSYSGFTDSILDSQEPGSRNIVSASVVNNTDIKKLDSVFGTSFNQRVEFAEIKYITSENNTVTSLNTSYIPLSLFPNIIEEIREKKPSYDILRGKYPLIPVKTKSSLEVVYTDQADAQHLKVQTGQPLIRIENMLYSKSGQVVELVISKYRADNCRLVFENSK